MPSNPAFEAHVQTVGASQTFVAPGIAAALVDADQELDPNVYPGDLMSATLAPGVRELPSALDVQILDVVNGLSAPPPPVAIPGPMVATPPVSPTTVVHQAVAALGNTSTSGGLPAATSPEATVAIPVQPAAYHKRHKVTVKPKHSAPAHGHKPATHKVIAPAHHRSNGKPVPHTPNASLAVELSLASRETSRPFHRPFKK